MKYKIINKMKQITKRKKTKKDCFLFSPEEALKFQEELISEMDDYRAELLEKARLSKLEAGTIFLIS